MPAHGVAPIVAHSDSAGHSATVAVAVLAVVAFWWAWRRAPARSAAPLVWWTAGTTALVAATLPSVEEAAEGSFLAHMVQHLVLWVVVPPLVLAAHPVHALRRAGLRPPARVVAVTSRHPGWRLAAAWIAIVVTMYGTHLTGMYDLALRNQWVHEAEHVAYVVAAVLLWSTVLGRGRSLAPARAGLAAATVAPLVVLGMVLTTADSPLYPTYVRELGPTAAMADQRNGASLMWLGSMLALVPLIVLSVWRWADREHEAQVRLEAASDGGVDHAA